MGVDGLDGGGIAQLAFELDLQSCNNYNTSIPSLCNTADDAVQ